MRTHKELSSIVKKFLDLSDATDDEFVVALDTEGSVVQGKTDALPNPALLQIATQVGDRRLIAVI